MSDDYQDILEAGKKVHKEFWAGLTWGEAFRMMWLLVWRGAAFGALSSVLITIVVDLFNLTNSLTVGLLFGAYYVFHFFIIGPFVVAQLFRKDFKGFRVVIKR